MYGVTKDEMGNLVSVIDYSETLTITATALAAVWLFTIVTTSLSPGCKSTACGERKPGSF